MTTVGGDRATGAPNDMASPVTPDPLEVPDSTPSSHDTPPPGRRRPRHVRLVAAAVLAGLAVAGVGGAVGGLTVLALRPTAVAQAPAAATDLTAVVDVVAPAVVRIQAGDPDTGTAGTAVVLTPSGDVVTNEHLVAGQNTATLVGDPSVSVEDIAFAIPSERVRAVLSEMGLVVPTIDGPPGSPR